MNGSKTGLVADRFRNSDAHRAGHSVRLTAAEDFSSGGAPPCAGLLAHTQFSTYRRPANMAALIAMPGATKPSGMAALCQPVASPLWGT